MISISKKVEKLKTLYNPVEIQYSTVILKIILKFLKRISISSVCQKIKHKQLYYLIYAKRNENICPHIDWYINFQNNMFKAGKQ